MNILNLPLNHAPKPVLSIASIIPKESAWDLIEIDREIEAIASGSVSGFNCPATNKEAAFLAFENEQALLKQSQINAIWELKNA